MAKACLNFKHPCRLMTPAILKRPINQYYVIYYYNLIIMINEF